MEREGSDAAVSGRGQNGREILTTGERGVTGLRKCHLDERLRIL